MAAGVPSGKDLHILGRRVDLFLVPGVWQFFFVADGIARVCIGIADRLGRSRFFVRCHGT